MRTTTWRLSDALGREQTPSGWHQRYARPRRSHVDRRWLGSPATALIAVGALSLFGAALTTPLASGSPGATERRYIVSVEQGMPYGMDRFPYVIPVDPRHIPHSEFGPFISVQRGGETYVATFPTQTAPDGVYGGYWYAPVSTAPNMRLAGVRLKGVVVDGATSDSLVPIYVMAKSGNGAFVPGRSSIASAQGLAGTAQAVVADPDDMIGSRGAPVDIALLLDVPVPVVTADEYLFGIDAEYVAFGTGRTVFPRSIRFERMEWLWVLDRDLIAVASAAPTAELPTFARGAHPVGDVAELSVGEPLVAFSTAAAATAAISGALLQRAARADRRLLLMSRTTVE